MNYKITPKSLILSILQEIDREAIPIKALVQVGDIFGFSGNTIRVTVVRLIREGVIESDERGLYRLSAAKHPLRKFINSWRYGESRVRLWGGDWLAGWLPKLPQGQLQKTQKALNVLGFREGLAGLWVRPDNINIIQEDLSRILVQLGGHPDVVLFVAGQFNKKLTDRWVRFLWPLDAMNDSHTAIRHKLEKSALQLSKMPIEDALRESYILGSSAIHSLNTDPLLPDEMVPSQPRIQLTKTMLAYDKLGKEIWAEKFNGLDLNKTPAHLQLVSDLR